MLQNKAQPRPCTTLLCPVSSYLTLSCPVSSFFAFFCPFLSCLIINLFGFALSCPVKPYQVPMLQNKAQSRLCITLLWPVSSYLTLSCAVPSSLAFFCPCLTCPTINRFGYALSCPVKLYHTPMLHYQALSRPCIIVSRLCVTLLYVIIFLALTPYVILP